MPNPPTSRSRLMIAAIIALAAIVRFTGLNFGLPNLYLADEEFFVQPALKIADGHLDPGWYGAPGQTLIYATGFVMRGVNVFVNSGQTPNQPASWNYSQDPTPFQTAGRAIPALAGIACVWLIWLVGRRMSEPIGLLSAVGVATSFYLVDHSHILRPDILQTMFLLLGAYGMWRLKETGRLSWAIIIGVAFGLSVTTKYPSLFMVPPILGLAWYGLRRSWWSGRTWRWAIAVGVVTVFLSAPFIFIHPIMAAKDIVYEGTADHGGHSNLGGWGNLVAYTQVLGYQIGSLLALLTIGVGAVAVICRRPASWSSATKAVWLVTGIAVWYVLVLCVLKSNWDRWTIPAMTLMAIPVAAAIMTLWSWRRWLTVVVCILACVGPSWRLARTMYGYTHRHTADQVVAWFTTHVNPGTVIVREPKGPNLGSAFQMTDIPNLTVHDLAWYEERQINYAILNSGTYGRILNYAAEAKPRPEFVAAAKTYRRLLGMMTLELVQVAGPAGGSQRLLYQQDWGIFPSFSLALHRGPDFWVYRLP